MNRCASHFRRAMTLIELLVVILIIAALLAVAVPSFSSMLYSSESSLAESQLHGAIRTARDAALRSPNRDDAALVFSYEPAPGGGRLVMTPCISTMIDFYDMPATLGPVTIREVFVPIAGSEPVQLPRHWMVNGYAPANSITAAGVWYEGSNRYGQTAGSGDWVFPETGFYIPTAADEGRFRNSFIVRFTAGTGIITTHSAAPSLVLLPSPQDPPNFNNIPAAEAQEMRTLRLSNPRRYVERLVTSTTISAQTKRHLLGVNCPDMVTVRPVSAVALYDVTRMAEGLRARLDPETGSLYRPHTANQAPTFVPLAGAGGTPTDDDAQGGIFMNQWIEGNTDFTGGVERREDGDEPEARIFTIDRHSGVLQRVETQQ